MDDRKIEEKLRRIVKKKGLPVTISVRDGIARLTGQVLTWEDVCEVGHLAGNLKEVREVINEVKTHEVNVKERQNPQKIVTNPLPAKADVVIIGGGVIGCFIARELSRYNLDTVLLEKESDVACGATKANNAQIHTGMGEKSGTLKKELCRKAWPLYDTIARELDVPFKRNGLLVILTKDTLSRKIPSFISSLIIRYVLVPMVVKEGKKVGDTPRVIKKEELHKIEPNVTDRTVSAVLMPNYGVICPYKLTIALVENAVHNGVTFLLETRATGIVTEDNKVRAVVTDRGTIQTDFVINAAGVFADEVAAMAGAQEYTIHPRKGCILLFDKELQGHVNHQVSEVKFPPDPRTKGGGVLITVDGNINWGPTALEVPDKEDTSVTREDIETAVERYGPIFPDLSRNGVITYFAGLRAATYKEDFVIKASDTVKGFIHVGGIQSPGLTAAPVIAEMVLTILREEGLKMVEKEDFDPVRKASPVFNALSVDERKELIKKNPLYGNVVCRCEHVTEGEIVEAIHSSLPAVTVDAVKRRTRAGMGRCQGGFCGPRVAALLAWELQIREVDVTKEGEGSHLFVGRTKEGMK